MLNKVILMGRLVADPELRRTNSGVSVTSFTIAVDRDFGKNENGEKATDFFEVVAWRQTGEFVSKYFTKGRMIVVDGKLQARSWTDKDGNKRKTVEVVADNCYFGDSKNSNSGSNFDNNVGNFSPAPAANFAMLNDDDLQLPF